MLFQQGDKKKGIEYTEEALGMLRQEINKNYIDIATLFLSLGNMYRDLNDVQKAALYNNQGITLYRQYLPFNHPWLGTAFINLSQFYFQINSYQQAEHFAKEAYQTYLQTLGPTHRYTIMSLDFLAQAYYKQERIPEAIEVSKQVLEKAKINPLQSDLSVYECNYGVYLLYNAQYKEAIRHIKIAYDASSNFAFKLRYQTRIAEAFILKNEQTSALSELEEIISQYATHPEYGGITKRRAFLFQAHVLTALNKPILAKRMLNKASKIEVFPQDVEALALEQRNIEGAIQCVEGNKKQGKSALQNLLQQVQQLHRNKNEPLLMRIRQTITKCGN
jgi:tetratricopeptide (TPR) repeat protein